jgi:hypothetical protein
MVYGSLKGEYGSVLSQVWSGLGSDVRQQAIQLLAQLAFNLVVSQSTRPSAQEKDHAQTRFAQG